MGYLWMKMAKKMHREPDRCWPKTMVVVAAVAAVSLVSGAGAAASGAAHRCPTPESDLSMTHTSSTWPDTVDRAWAAYVL